MNRNVLLIAAREFRQIAKTRSFWLTLLILPIALAISPMISRLIDRDIQQTVMLVDKSPTGAGRAIARRIDFEHQRAVLTALADFAADNDLQELAPNAVWSRKADWYGDIQVAQFMAQGGVKAALRTIRARDPALADSFETPKASYRIVATPRAVTEASDADLPDAVKPYVSPPDGSRRKATDYVLAIPADFGAQPVVQLWTAGRPRAQFMAILQTELTSTLRSGYLEAQGVSAPVAARVNGLEPAIAITRPEEVAGREKQVVQSILPVAMTYILLMSLIMSGQWMLQSTIEERGGKLIEAVLACASPNDFMYGKLLGTIAIGLLMVATWLACGMFAAYATQGTIADLIRPALAPLSSFSSVATIFYFFLAGYLMIALIFLVIGAMSDSMQDAQGFLVPVMLVLMFPVIILMQLVISGTESVLIEVLTWIPLVTPFAVLARLGSGIPTIEVVGAGLLLAAFIALEFILLGRVFRASLLSGAGRPSLKRLGGLLRRN